MAKVVAVDQMANIGIYWQLKDKLNMWCNSGKFCSGLMLIQKLNANLSGYMLGNNMKRSNSL